MIGTLEQSIIQTLAYFDIFDYPLTREELFQFLWQAPPNLCYTDFVVEVENSLQNELKGKVESSAGYYFFAGRGETILKRERKIFYTEEKIAIAKRGASKLRYIPFVRALFVCNQLPVGVKKESDIDVFIVVKRGHMWLTRALVTAVLSFFLLRRSNKNIADLLCLSFYVTDDNLDLKSICIPEPDVYQAYWNAQLIPLYDPQNLYDEVQQRNAWITQYLPHAEVSYDILHRWKVSETPCTQTIKRFLEWIFAGHRGAKVEKHIRFLQLQKMNLNEKSHDLSPSKNVVISDTMLKFHENDRKQYFKDEWEKRWKEKI